MNAEVTIRDATLADAAAIAQVHVSAWRTTYPGIVPQDYIDSRSVEEREGRWAGRLADPSSDWHIF
ncbi:MAG TPA: hypothetical protein VFW40_14090, partial [Capsulimonadaceae bacterium]|nr:hypothetical protein [Capsulimonadaceae bacterium]